MTALQPKPMKYHGPGWGLDLDDRFDSMFQVWAPKEGRDGWQAAWSTRRGEDGDHRKADTLGEALDVFDSYHRAYSGVNVEQLRTAFRLAVQTAGLVAS